MVTDSVTNVLTTLLGDGSGAFNVGAAYSTSAGPRGVVINDFNRDGVSDVAVAVTLADAVEVRLGQGDGVIGAASLYTVGGWPQSLGVLDNDGDGILDLVVANSLTDDIAVLNGKGDGTFALDLLVDVGEGPRSLAVGDIDQDGFMDVVCGNIISDDVSVLKGPFVEGLVERRFAAPGSPHIAGLVDLSGDGVADIVASTSTGYLQTLAVWPSSP